LTNPRASARSQILEWAEQGAVPPENVSAALALAGATPDASQWRRFVSALLLWLGALLVAAGVIFFFAYNWHALGRFTKFGLVEGLLAVSLVAAWIAGPDKPAGKASLLLASLLTGALLALVGQTYQTGADTFELFAWWAALILPWTIAARTPALWMLWLALLNLAATFYFQAFRGFFGAVAGDTSLVWALAGLNTVALIVWEAGVWRGYAWMQDRWPARLIAVAGGTAVTFLGLWGIFEASDPQPLAFLAYFAWLAAAYYYYRRQTRDLFVLAGGVLSLIVFVTSWLSNSLLRQADAGSLLFIGVVVIGMSAAGAWWLKGIATKQEDDEVAE
jgi:uncharacterized membrane protein